MGGIDYARMARLCARADELGTAPDAKPSVKLVYEERTKSALAEFVAAHDALAVAETAWRKESREAHEALATLDQPYAEARAVLFAYLPDASLPETLKAQPTDTDRKRSIERLLDAVDDHAGQSWADGLLSGPFGTRAAAVIQEVNESIAANAALAAARDARANKFGVAYERYLAFKNVVRNAYGPSSPQYRRIHLRANASSGEDEPTS
ncbi:MAG: hypothetical protein U0271_31345 [Polyangiaceae bacterium]